MPCKTLNKNLDERLIGPQSNCEFGARAIRCGGRAIFPQSASAHCKHTPRTAAKLDQAARATRAACQFHGNNSSIRSEEHTSELQSLMRNPYAVFCLQKKKNTNH